MRIVNEDGEQTTSLEEMKGRIVDYFVRLYCEQRSTLVPYLNPDFSDAISNAKPPAKSYLLGFDS